MKIKQVLNELTNTVKNNSKLQAVRIVNIIRGGGLLKSKEIVDNLLFKDNIKFGKECINYLKITDEWGKIKSNIRKLKSL